MFNKFHRRFFEAADDGIGGGGAGDPVAAESEARMFGWVPKEEFKGPEEKWRTAEEFLEEGKRINGFLRKDLDKLRSALTQRDADIADLRSTIEEFAKFHQETEARAYERAKKTLQEERKAALRENDGERVADIEERLEMLGDGPKDLFPKKQPQRPTASQSDPVWEGWLSENPWFAKDQRLRAVTNGYADIVKAEAPNLVGRAFLDEVTRRVQQDFPEHFGNSERKRASAVGGSGEHRAGTGKKSYADLPAEAQAACDKFVKQGLIKSREDYVKEYFGE